MRVTGPWTTSDEDGAVAIVVAISMLVLLSVAALTIDLGSLWWGRRDVVVDVDAAALAAAAHAASRVQAGANCNSADPLTGDTPAEVAADVISANDPTTIFDPDDPLYFPAPTCSGTGGRVSVAASRPGGSVFAGVFGGGPSATDVPARSSAEFGPIVGADRLRPLPLCISGDASTPTAYEAWREYETSGPPKIPNVTHPLFAGMSVSGPAYKVVVDDGVFASVCNPSGLPASGGFRWIDFDGEDGGTNGAPCPEEAASGGAAELKDRFAGGYPCVVFTHAYLGAGESHHDAGASGHNCRPDAGGWAQDSCPSGDGVSSANLRCIEGSAGCTVNQVCPDLTAATSCAHIWTLLIYDALEPDPLLSGPAAGNQPRFHPIGFVNVVPRAVQATGASKYVAVEFIGLSTGQGVIGNGAVASPAHHLIGVRLCAAELQTSDALSCTN